MAPDPIDWPTARKVARFVARRDALADSYLGTSLRDDFTADALIATLRSVPASHWRTLSRVTVSSAPVVP